MVFKKMIRGLEIYGVNGWLPEIPEGFGMAGG